MKRIILAVTVAAANLAGAASAEQYVCQADQTTGFFLNDSGRWVSSIFNNENDFLVNSMTKTVSEFGGSTQFTSDECSMWEVPLGPNTEETHVVMRCSNRQEQFTMSLDSYRFNYTNGGNGYIMGDDYPYTPTLVIGRCAELGG